MPVSIPPRLRGRGRPTAATISPGSSLFLTPPPSEAGGDVSLLAHSDQPKTVSIRPRLGGRGRPWSYQTTGLHTSFQSAPGSEAGGDVRLTPELGAMACFNPPPARRPGETEW